MTPYWPQANGMVERFMANLNKICRNTEVGNKSIEVELNLFLRNYRACHGPR